MPIITLKTIINAPIEKCFNLSRSIDLHVKSMHSFQEEAVAGRQSGLIDLNETVTWKAKHFKINIKMTVKITKMKLHDYFLDEMITGPFKKLHHQHLFKPFDTKTEMTDIFEFESPLGVLGKFVDYLFLEEYMQKLLIERNRIIKEEAEKC